LAIERKKLALHEAKQSEEKTRQVSGREGQIAADSDQSKAPAEKMPDESNMEVVASQDLKYVEVSEILRQNEAEPEVSEEA
jgi:hypothetical protein